MVGSRHLAFEHVEQWISFFFVRTTPGMHNVDPGEIEEICARHELQHFEMSAVTGEGVELLFREVAERECNGEIGTVARHMGTININERRTAKEGKCC
jgi:hypothetical protein